MNVDFTGGNILDRSFFGTPECHGAFSGTARDELAEFLEAPIGFHVVRSKN